jgi:hypothetical protein
MIEMMAQIKRGQIPPESIPTFEELYEQVEREIYG